VSFHYPEVIYGSLRGAKPLFLISLPLMQRIHLHILERGIKGVTSSPFSLLERGSHILHKHRFIIWDIDKLLAKD